jgi:hypothetical protein
VSTLDKMAKYAKGARRSGGGAFGEIDRLLQRFLEDKKRFRAAAKERLGSPRALRSIDGLYAVRWMNTLYRAPSVDALLEKLPQRAPQPPKDEAAVE